MAKLLEFIEKNATLLMQYMFAVVLILFLCVLVVYSLIDSDVRSLWVAAGLAATILLLVTKERGASLFLAVMLIGTLVAREEFILDAAAVIRGEKLQDVRQSRIGAVNYYEASSHETVELKDEIADLLKSTMGGPGRTPMPWP